jgi:hypothetical protein
VKSRAIDSVADLGRRFPKTESGGTSSVRSKLVRGTSDTFLGLSCSSAFVTLVTERLIHSNLEQLFHEWFGQRRVEGEAKSPLRRCVLFNVGL